jgi:beta-lactamase superfamily II metal-dependent hydrolase
MKRMSFLFTIFFVTFWKKERRSDMLKKSRSPSVLSMYVLLVLFSAFMLLPTTAAVAAWTQGKFEIYLFDVGQADSQLIVSPTGKTLLIDAGEKTWNSSRNANAIADKIRQVMGPSFGHLDYIVTTHLHTDHIGTPGYGGIWRLIEIHNFTVGKLIDRDAGVWVDSNHDGVCDPHTEIVWHNVGTTSGTAGKWLCYAMDPANANKLHREVATVDSTSQIDLGPGVTVKIIESDAKGVKMSDGTTPVEGNHSAESLPPSENDYSITLKVTYGNLKYVTGGDTDGEYASSSYGYKYNDVESVIAPGIGRVDVIKANHHGSSHSSNQTYIDTLHPTVSLISCGADNTYGHPDQAILDRLLSKSKVYFTETCDPSRNYGASVIVNGDIVISSSDGINYTVNRDAYNSGGSQTADTTAPIVTGFRVHITPATFTTYEVKVALFTATDVDGAVTGYKITESGDKPSPNDAEWISTRPATYKIKSPATQALYGWGKDSTGNVSEGRQAEVWFEQ